MLAKSIVASAWKHSRVARKAFVAAPKAFSVEKKIPDSFYDEKAESEKEFLDITTSLTTGGLQDLTNVKTAVTWEEIKKASTEPISFNDEDGGEAVRALKAAGVNIEDYDGEGDLKMDAFLASMVDTELGAHLDQIKNSVSVPTQMLNDNLPWRKSVSFPEPVLENFIEDTSFEKHRFDKQGNRACPGKLQRRGKAGELQCHKIDLTTLHHLDIMTLRNFLSIDGEIQGRKVTGLCAKCQRQVAKAIKRSRNFGILPHLGQFEIQASVLASEGAVDASTVKISKVIFKK